MHNRPWIAFLAVGLGVGYFVVLLPARLAEERKADELALEAKRQEEAAKRLEEVQRRQNELQVQFAKRRAEREFETERLRTEMLGKMLRLEQEMPMPMANPRPPDPGPLKVAGRLVNADGLPMVGAEVEIFTLVGSFDEDAPLRAGRRLASGTTNRQGIFRIRVHWPGEVWIAAKDSKGRLANTSLDLSPGAESYPLSEADEALYGADAEDLVVVGDLTMGRPPRVRGFVRDAVDHGVAGAKVQLTAGDLVTDTWEVVTDAQGGFWATCRTYPCHIAARATVRGEETDASIDAQEGEKPELLLPLAQVQLAER